MIPSKNQWAKWSLPSKYTSLGLIVSIVGLLLGAVYWYFTPAQYINNYNQSESKEFSFDTEIDIALTRLDSLARKVRPGVSSISFERDSHEISKLIEKLRSQKEPLTDDQRARFHAAIQLINDYPIPIPNPAEEQADTQLVTPSSTSRPDFNQLAHRSNDSFNESIVALGPRGPNDLKYSPSPRSTGSDGILYFEGTPGSTIMSRIVVSNPGSGAFLEDCDISPVRSPPLFDCDADQARLGLSEGLLSTAIECTCSAPHLGMATAELACLEVHGAESRRLRHWTLVCPRVAGVSECEGLDFAPRTGYVHLKSGAGMIKAFRREKIASEERGTPAAVIEGCAITGSNYSSFQLVESRDILLGDSYRSSHLNLTCTNNSPEEVMAILSCSTCGVPRNWTLVCPPLQ